MIMILKLKSYDIAAFCWYFWLENRYIGRSAFAENSFAISFNFYYILFQSRLHKEEPSRCVAEWILAFSTRQLRSSEPAGDSTFGLAQIFTFLIFFCMSRPNWSQHDLTSDSKIHVYKHDGWILKVEKILENKFPSIWTDFPDFRTLENSRNLGPVLPDIVNWKIGKDWQRISPWQIIRQDKSYVYYFTY